MQLLLQRWRDPESGLDSAEAPTYKVLLSFPSQEQPNRVAVGELLLWRGDAWRVGELRNTALTLPHLHSGSHWGHPLLLSPE